MQVRTKWQEVVPVPQAGDLVILTDDLQPPQKWPLARVEKLRSRPDGRTRVLTLKTPPTTLKRPLNKVILSPINDVAADHRSLTHTLATAGGVSTSIDDISMDTDQMKTSPPNEI